MKQFILPEYFSGEKELVLEEKDSHYLRNVLRIKPGKKLACTDSSGRSWNGTVSIREKDVILELEPAETAAAEECADEPEIYLYQCLIKGKNMDLIIRQATEAGIKAVIPVDSEFAQIHLKDFKKEKPERWDRIIKEAMQQSNSRIRTTVPDMVRIDNIPQIGEGEAGLFFHQEKLAENTLHRQLVPGLKKIFIFIGPEGGLSDKDIEILRTKGFRSIYLGSNILRAETAAIYAAAAVKTIVRETFTTSL